MRYALEELATVLACLAFGFVFGYHEGSKASYVRCPSVPGGKVLTTINDNGKNSCVYGQVWPGQKTVKVSL